MEVFERVLVNLPIELQDIILENALATCYKKELLQYLNTVDDSNVKFFNKSFNNIFLRQHELSFEENPNFYGICEIDESFKPYVNFFNFMNSRKLNFNHLLVDSYNLKFSSLIFALINGCKTFECKNIDTFLMLGNLNDFPNKLTRLSWGELNDDAMYNILLQTILQDKKFSGLQEIEIEISSNFLDSMVELISCLKNRENAIKLNISIEHLRDQVEDVLRLMDRMGYDYKNVKFDVNIAIPGNFISNTYCDIKSLTLENIAMDDYENYKSLFQLLQEKRISVETLFIDCDHVETYGNYNWLSSTNLKTLKIRSPHLSVDWLNKNTPHSVSVLDITLLKYYDTPFIVPYNIDYLIINVEKLIPNALEFLDLSKSSISKIRIVDNHEYEYAQSEFSYNFRALPDLLESIDILLNKVTDYKNKSFVVIRSTENIGKSLYSRRVHFNCHAALVDNAGNRIV